MKKVLSYILISIVTFVLPAVVVSAAESLTIDCNGDTIVAGQSKTCDILANSDSYKITGVNFAAEVDGILTLDSLTAEASFGADAINGNNYAGANSSGVDSGSKVGTITVTAASNAELGSEGTITLSAIGMGVLVDGTPTDVEDSISNATAKLTIGESSDASADSTTDGSVSENPKTMDTNTFVIVGILVLGLGTVLVSKKHLSKIGK